MSRYRVEACLSPALFEYSFNPESIAVVIDTLRASSAICSALSNGAKELIPVATLDEAREYKKKGYLVAAERDGYVLDFADFGNSPFNFTAERVKDKTIVYSTTNGTKTIEMASACRKVVVGSFLNISALCNWLLSQESDILLLCAGWKNRVNLEDTFFAGAMAAKLLKDSMFFTDCDSVKIALDLWEKGGRDPLEYVQKAAQRKRLGEKGLDDCIPFCHTPDSSKVIPVLAGRKIIILDT
ncbi:MAG: 2-phosphosulfolactate phosphatase [Marinilabiliaceae bacterium]|jgi:2-phosphosulfolactate phosphatase|nr:2-phosphosulfolactate phosphatase [Marinilabiliaceae bacterium]